MIEAQIRNDISEAITRLQKSGEWPQFDVPVISVIQPVDSKHGDFSSTIAMQLAGLVGKHPIAIAEELQGIVRKQYSDVQVVHPGFINFFVSNEQLGQSVAAILDAGETYGQSTLGHGGKVLLEFISANPTGPLTLPNGRGGYLGDVLANVMTALGYEVIREYYVNDRGNQIDILGESVARRYLQSQGLNVPYAENLYQGEYIADLAKRVELKDYKLTNSKKMAWVKDRIKQQALKFMLEEIRRVVEQKMHIHYDNWFSEKSLYDSGLVDMVVDKLRERGHVYEQDGAWWLKTSAFGDDKDRVVVKQTGEGSYLQGDIALFYDRSFERKFDHIVTILGADHHGYEKRMKALPRMFDTQTTYDIIFIQMATLMKDGEEVRMSKRAGNFVTIEELIDEVGNDVARFFFLMYTPDRHMNFDLGLAKEQSQKNPVYYVQYAHARLCSVLREVNARGVALTEGHSVASSVDPVASPVVLTHEAERALVKQLLKLPPLLESISHNYEAHHLTTYAMETARSFHHFYDHCRVIDEEVVNPSRVALVRATRVVLAKTLGLLGVAAPEKM